MTNETLLQAIQEERVAYNQYLNAEPMYIAAACVKWKAAEMRLNAVLAEIKGVSE